MQLRQYSLILAEAFDAWRIVPRTMLICYGWIVFQLYIWFKSIPTYVQEKCDPQVLTLALNKAMSLPEAKLLACTVVDVVGGPTSAQSAFVTTIIGLSTGIFGLYTATGRRWDGWDPSQSRNANVGRDGGAVAPAPSKPAPDAPKTPAAPVSKPPIKVPDEDQPPEP